MRGRVKAVPIDRSLCAGIIPQPQTCEEWWINARIVADLVERSHALKSIADAIGISQSTVSRWHKTEVRWPAEVKTRIHNHPGLFPSGVLASMATRLWTDIDPGGRRDGRRAGRPKLSLRSAVELIIKGKKLSSRRESLATQAKKMQDLANRERARSFKLLQENKDLSEKYQHLERQLSLHRFDDMLREIAFLKQALVKARAGAKVAPPNQKSPDIIYLENRLRSFLHCRVDLDHSNGILVVNGGNREIIEAVIERIMKD